MKKLAILISCTVALIGISKNAFSSDREQIEEKTPKWIGTYKGVLPAASSEGVETTVTLRGDLTYTYTVRHAGTNDKGHSINGSFSWRQDQQPIIVLTSNYEGSRYYYVGDGYLYHLDKDGNRVEGKLAEHYKLAKMSSEITERYWKLTEINGEAVPPAEARKDAFLIFKPENVSGCTGCNNLNGPYKVTGDKLSFGNMATTRMMCGDMTLENSFLKMIKEVHGYAVEGDKLRFTNDKGETIAMFENVLL